MPDFYHLHALDCARRASEREAAILHSELGRGTTRLQAIGRIAPLLGMFGTGMLLMDALPAYYHPACSIGDCAGGISETLVPIALSLFVAISASGVFHSLNRQVQALDLEMRTATLDLLNDLDRLRFGCK